MAYRTIVVSLNNAERSPMVLEAAVTAARIHDAHLIGLFVIPGIQVHVPIALQVATDVLESHREYFLQKARETEALFNERTRREDLVAEWQMVDASGGLVADAILDRGRCADLIVVGQTDPKSDIVDVPGLPERLLLESGRPVLLIPAAGRAPRTIGERVTVAWSGTREAARAVFDALPFLQRAQQVNVLCIDPSEEEPLPGAEISATLARHGVKAEAHRSMNAPLAVGDELLSRVADDGADLLVMGGYGHSRMRVLVLGGATRHILRHMTLPVLMSH